MQVEFDDGRSCSVMLLTMFPMGSGTTASTSTEREHIDIEPLLEWAGKWTDGNEQATLQEGFAHTLEDTARAYPISISRKRSTSNRVTTSKRRSTPGSTTIGEGVSYSPRAAGRRSSGCRPSPTLASVLSS